MKGKKLTRKSSNSESGAILPIVVILMLALTITGLAFLNAGVMENSLVGRQIHKNQAFYLAEAGVEATIWQFNYGDPSWPSPPWTDEDGDGSPTRTETLYDSEGNSVGDYEVTVEDKDGNNPVIESTGYVPRIEAEKKVEKTIRVTLERTHHQMFDFAIASEAGIIAENLGTEITGSCYTIGDITIEGATVNGDAIATGSITVTDGGNVTGTTTEGADELPFPEFESDYYQYWANSIINGDLNIEGVAPYMVDGILYVTGNVTISNSTLVGPGSIVTEGWIKVEENSQLGTSSETGVSLISAYEGEEAIKIEEGNEENPTVVWGTLWSPNGAIKIEKHSMIYGSTVSGREYKIETGSEVIYHSQFNEDFYSYVTRPVYLVQRWEEE